MDDNRSILLVSSEEEDRIARSLMVWINKYPDPPVDLIKYEQLQDGEPSMAVSTIQSTYIVQEYINGSYDAEFQFKIIYRVQPGTSMDKRLKADEKLNAIADWATRQKPDFGEDIEVKSIKSNTRSSLFGIYENGDEDHQILMTLTYHVKQ